MYSCPSLIEKWQPVNLEPARLLALGDERESAQVGQALADGDFLEHARGILAGAVAGGDFVARVRRSGSSTWR